MPLDLFKGISRAMGPLVAKGIDKKDFLLQLQEAWSPIVKKNTDLDEEVKNAMERIAKSGFEKTFKSIGITEEDIRGVLLNIRDSKSEPVKNLGRDVGRNDPCPCGSGKKYKRCCGY